MWLHGSDHMTDLDQMGIQITLKKIKGVLSLEDTEAGLDLEGWEEL